MLRSNSGTDSLRSTILSKPLVDMYSVPFPFLVYTLDVLRSSLYIACAHRVEETRARAASSSSLRRFNRSRRRCTARFSSADLPDETLSSTPTFGLNRFLPPPRALTRVHARARVSSLRTHVTPEPSCPLTGRTPGFRGSRGSRARVIAIVRARRFAFHSRPSGT